MLSVIYAHSVMGSLIHSPILCLEELGYYAYNCKQIKSFAQLIHACVPTLSSELQGWMWRREDLGRTSHQSSCHSLICNHFHHMLFPFIFLRSSFSFWPSYNTVLLAFQCYNIITPLPLYSTLAPSNRILFYFVACTCLSHSFLLCFYYQGLSDNQ